MAILTKKMPAGQLLVPRSRNRWWGGRFAIDNGAFTHFDETAFLRLLAKEEEHRDSCLFVAAPDIVACARRTIEVFKEWEPKLTAWPVAFVCQDGQEDLSVPWGHITAIFIGGSTRWKMSKAAADLIKAAKIIGRHVHVGRVNTVARWEHFAGLGADTCDGNGLHKFDHMLDGLVKGLGEAQLFEK